MIDRKAPEGWVHIATAWEAIESLDNGRVVAQSLDHDLGDGKVNGRAIDVVNSWESSKRSMTVSLAEEWNHHPFGKSL
jgi:hypothetical protein